MPSINYTTMNNTMPTFKELMIYSEDVKERERWEREERGEGKGR